MKIILSRKGFDSSNGGCPSPIMPDGTLLSMPIPSEYNQDRYDELQYDGRRYSDILADINPSGKYMHCHVDPDIRDDVRIKSIPDHRAAFGQIGAARGVLRNAHVEKGDIFLFFGWFRQTEYKDGKLRFVKRSDDFYGSADLHVIYGYMQIGDIITDRAEIQKFYWHPHSRFTSDTNAIYLPSERLSLDKTKKGHGVLDCRTDRVLTMKGKNRGTWNDLSFLRPQYVYGSKKNSAGGEGLYYSGIWQELVVYESDGLLDWVKSVIM